MLNLIILHFIVSGDIKLSVADCMCIYLSSTLTPTPVFYSFGFHTHNEWEKTLGDEERDRVFNKRKLFIRDFR